MLRISAYSTSKNNKPFRGVIIMKNLFYAIFILAVISSGCAPVVVGGAATGAYKTGTDERTMGTMVDDSTISSKVKMRLINASDVKRFERYSDSYRSC